MLELNYNAAQNVWQNLKKSRKISEERKTLICFVVIFDRYWQKVIFGRETGH